MKLKVAVIFTGTVDVDEPENADELGRTMLDAGERVVRGDLSVEDVERSLGYVMQVAPADG